MAPYPGLAALALGYRRASLRDSTQAADMVNHHKKVRRAKWPPQMNVEVNEEGPEGHPYGGRGRAQRAPGKDAKI
jgi:hypothetical protein